MRSTRLDLVAILAALVGLVVSIAAMWPWQLTNPSSNELPGPPVSAPQVSNGQHRGEPTGRADVPTARSNGGNTRSDGQQPKRSATPDSALGDPWAPRPVAVDIDAIDYAAEVRPTGVDAAGQMALPENLTRLGWYRFGAAPGEAGSTVLAGHLDSVTYGIGPLVRLRDVEVGDDVALTTADGTTTQYVVTSVNRHDRSALPTELFSREGPPKLRLITCGGEYDADSGGYQLNLVVTAVPV